MTTLTHRTTNDQLYRWNKQELLIALEEHGTLDGLTLSARKDTILSRVIELRNLLIDEHDHEIAEQQAKREQELEADKNNPVFVQVQHNLLAAVDDEINRQEAKLVEVKEKVAESKDLAYIMRTQFEEVVEAQSKIQCLASLAKYISNDEYTKSEFLSTLQGEAEEVTRRVLTTTEYEHRSTCSLRNLESQVSFKVQQWHARFLNQVTKLVKEAYETGDAVSLRFSFFYL